MGDFISRRKMIDAMRQRKEVFCKNRIEFMALPKNEQARVDEIDNCISDLVNAPDAEPERKKGKWIEISWSEPDPNVCCTSYAIQSAKCSICGKYHTTPYLHNLVYFPYCPNCGAEMTRGDHG